MIHSFFDPETLAGPLLSWLLGSRSYKAQALPSRSSKTGSSRQRNRCFQLTMTGLCRRWALMLGGLAGLGPNSGGVVVREDSWRQDCLT